jgi:multidrug efflux system outer membrane protein
MNAEPTSTAGRLALAATLVAALAACATGAPVPDPAQPPAPPQWQAPLPHGGQLGDLQRWWQQFDDPLVAQLVDASQQASPSIAAARSRIVQARAARTISGAALLPTLDANAAANRGRFEAGTPVVTSASASLDAAWEIDVFGGNRAGTDAAQARLEGSEAAWHEARVSVAAETASTYVALRTCEAQLAQARFDAASRAETARLTDLAARAGFQAPASADLARASAAQGNAILTAQRAQCDQLVKALVELTAIDEPALRTRLAASTARVPGPAELAVPGVPAQVLAQRPDLYAAAREVAAASADTRQAEARRYPRIALAGSIGPQRIESGNVSVSDTVWRVGPVTVSLPLFDAGARRANVEAARARYDAATSAYAGSLRTAVREVESALVELQSTAARGEDARVAAEGFERSYRATESLYRGGLASLFDLEDSRRNAVVAQRALIDLQRERVAAWIALYRALGGGWPGAEAQASGGQAGPDAQVSGGQPGTATQVGGTPTGAHAPERADPSDAPPRS